MEYVSHELQFFADFSDKLNTTTGLFYYNANITQRGDYYDSNGNGRYAQGFDYAQAGRVFASSECFRRSVCSPPNRPGCAAQRVGRDCRQWLRPLASAFRGHAIRSSTASAKAANRGAHECRARPDTAATSSEYQTRSEREAFAVYSQGVYTFNEQFALTLGVRWSRDQLDGEENAFYQSEGATR